MPYVNCPPGLRSLRFEDGSRRVAAREGGRIEVSDGQAAAIDRMDGNGTAGLLTASFREFGETQGRPGRVCTGCGRRWYAWTTTCHSCHAPTEPG
jgi:hypothetical protein